MVLAWFLGLWGLSWGLLAALGAALCLSHSRRVCRRRPGLLAALGSWRLLALAAPGPRLLAALGSWRLLALAAPGGPRLLAALGVAVVLDTRRQIYSRP